jgi:uncharacterized protein YceK
MTRRTLAVLSLAVLLSLAGCSGVLGPASTPTTTSDGTPDAGATTTTDDGSGGPIYQPPLSASTVLDGHATALEDGSTFRYVQRSRFRGVNGSGFLQETELTADVDLAADETAVSQNVTLQGESAAYGNATVGYIRIPTDDGPRYRRAPGNLTTPGFYQQPPIGRYVRGLNWTYRGATDRNGSTVYTYVVGDVDQLSPSAHGLDIVDPENVTSIDTRLSVREDGSIDSFEYRVRGVVDGVLVEYSLSVDWRQVGSTSVDRPAWVDDARNATGR